MREELKGHNFEVVTIAADAKGLAAIEPFVTAAGQRHPSLLDQDLRVADLYRVHNVPSAFWIDEAGRMIRANDPIYAQRRNRETGEVTRNEKYLGALRDWLENGERSRYAMDGERLDRRLPNLEREDVEAGAEFDLGVYLSRNGHADLAVPHFKRAHALRPGNWTYKRQAWNLGDIERDYGTTFIDAIQDPATGPFYPPLDLA